MGYRVFLFLLLAGFSTAAWAQRSLGYWFVAPGGATAAGHTVATIHMAGGGELALPAGFALGIEAGALARTKHFTDTVQGVASLNGYYHIRRSREIRLDPFATAGYSLFFRRGTANLANFGGGMNYWFLPSLAVRVEVRDHVLGNPATTHFWGVRFGMSFTGLSP